MAGIILAVAKEPTLQDIAKAAGVSRSTVSLALRNHPRIPAETRERVIRMAARLGYRPNAELARLMALLRESRERRDRPVMALVTDYEKPLSAAAPPSPTWLGFQRRATELGYLPEEFHLTHQISPARLKTILCTRAIRGVVFAGLRDPSFAAKMDLSGFAVATLGNAIQKPGLHRSTSDKHANTLHSCERLWAAGCRRIALVVPRQQEERVEHTFLSGYLIFHYLHRHPRWPELLVNEAPWEELRLIARWIGQHRPDAIIAAYPGLEDALRHGPYARRKLPRIALVNVSAPGECGMDQRHDLIAAGAVDLVDAQLKRNETGLPVRPKHLLIRGDWVG